LYTRRTLALGREGLRDERFVKFGGKISSEANEIFH